jgi:hypothetical protein
MTHLTRAVPEARIDGSDGLVPGPGRVVRARLGWMARMDTKTKLMPVGGVLGFKLCVVG